MGMGVMQGSGRGRRGRASRRAPMAEINVTPFVDVMLVLLIIFMVTAPLLSAGVPVDLPDSRANALPQDREPITISLDSNGIIYLEDEALVDGALQGRLARLCQSGGEVPQVTLRGDKTLQYGRMMAVMGELNRAGCNSIALVTNGSSAAPGPSISGSEGGA